MGSSSKFPSGLNNWVDSDKPVRADFATDNKVLDENILWKDIYDSDGAVAASGGIPGFSMAAVDYDSDGSVLAAGGIPGYTMSKSVYDPSGAVAQAGGIVAAIAQNDGFTLYTHSRSDGVHTLTAANDGPNVKFIATADFSVSDTFQINGVAYVAKTTNGRDWPDKMFLSGSVVVGYCSSGIFYAPVSGTSQNYDVVAVSDFSVMPVSPRVNTIALQTETPIGYYMLDTVQPQKRVDNTELQSGDVWIQLGSYSLYGFSTLPNNTAIIYPLAAMQWDGSVWNHKDAKIFQNGIWKDISAFLLDHSNMFDPLTGGYTHAKPPNASGAYQDPAFTTDGILLATTSYINQSFRVSKMIDLTAWNKLYFEYTTSYFAVGPCSLSLGVSLQNYVTYLPQAAQGWPAEYYLMNPVVQPTPVVAEIDVSGLTGSHYILGSSSSGASVTCTVAINRIWGA